MAVNKVEINGEVKLDLTQDTVTENTLLKGVTAHDAAGNLVEGKVVTTPVPKTSNLLKGDGAGGISTAVPGTDYLTEAPVTSVNGKTGDVEFAASDVGALPTTGGSMTGNIMFTGSGGARYGLVGVNGSGSLFIGFGRSKITFSDKTQFTGKADFSAAKIEGITGLLPTITESDNGKFLRVVNGAWAAAAIDNANGGSF